MEQEHIQPPLIIITDGGGYEYPETDQRHALAPALDLRCTLRYT